jgi:hypothetical protein
MSSAQWAVSVASKPRLARPIMPAILLGLIVAQVAVTRSYSLFSRGLWLDEYHTLLIVDDPSLSHAMEALKHGADTNAPGLYLLARAIGWGVGSSGPIVLRGIGFASVIAGLVGIYAMVRRVYSSEVALIAAIAAWSHPLLARHAFEARFYGPWFAGIVWFAYGLDLWDRSRRKAWPATLIAFTSVFVCTVHYLGILSLVLVATAHSLSRRRPWPVTLVRLLPAAAGLGALGLCLPFYSGQKLSLSVPTWLPRPDFAAVKTFLDSVYCYYIFAIPVVVYFVSRCLARPSRRGESTDEGEGVDGLAGLAGLALMPFLLVVFSYRVQSVLLDRYAIVAVASFGPLIAPLVARTRSTWRWAILGGFVLISSANLMAASRWFAISDSIRREAVDQVAGLPAGPILFRGRMDLDEFWWDAPSMRDRIFLWAPEDRGDRAGAIFQIERDMARNHERWYGLPKAASLASLRDRPVVYLHGLDAEDVLELQRSDPDLALRPIDRKRGLFEATRPREESLPDD